MNCASCGAELRPNTKFCGVCGAPVVSQPAAPPELAVQPASPVYCINCGTRLQPDDVFCLSCGARQDGAGAPAEPAYTPAVASYDAPSSERRKVGGSKLVVGVAAGVVALLVVGGGIFAMSQGSSDVSPSANPTVQTFGGGQTISYGSGQIQVTPVSGQATPVSTGGSGVPTQAVQAANAGATATAQAAPTATAQAAPTAAARAAATSTAQAIASATVRAQATTTAVARATATVQAQATAQAKATAQAADSEAAAMAQGARKLPTVLRGALDYRDDGKLSKRRWGVNLLNLVVEGRFFNPYDRNTRAWDYGLTFREGKTGQFRLSIHSDTEWYLKIEDWSSGKSTFETVGEGHIPWMEITPDGSNVLKVICKEADGIFFLNGQFVGKLNLSMHQESGDVAVAANFLSSSGIAGKSTRYEGFDLYEMK